MKPHHVLCMKSPTLLFQRFRGQILRLRTLHIVENEEKRFRGQALKEFKGVRMWKLLLQNDWI